MLFRRVRRSEINQLELLFNEDTRWYKYYDQNHSSWIKKALEDFEDNENRVVLGAFDYSYREGYGAEHKLISCIFLKKSAFENCIELKSLILPPKINITEQENITCKLIEKAIKFCEIRNVDKIEIELPQEENSIISDFLKFGFRVTSRRERYSSNIAVYVLEKTIGDIYYGDPFDNLSLAIWLLKRYLPCKVLETDSENDLIKIIFEGKIISKAFSEENIIGYPKRLRGIMWVLEYTEEGNLSDDISYIIEKSAHSVLKLVLTDKINNSDRNRLVKNDFIVFDRKEAELIAGGEMSSMSTPINIDEIGGIVTVLEYDAIRNLSKNESTTYYLFSGLHAGLSLSEHISDDDYDDSLILVVYCPNWENAAIGIVGFFEIDSLENKRFEDLIRDNVPEDSAISREDLRFYKIYSEKERVCILKCNRFHLFEKPIHFINSNWVRDKWVEQYLEKEIIINGSNSAYLDVTTCSNLKELFSSLTENLQGNKMANNMILESIAAAVGIIADTVTVTEFGKNQIKGWKDNLGKSGRDTQSVLKPAIKSLLEAHAQAIDNLVSKYRSTISNHLHNPLMKKEYCNSIASQVIEALELLEPFYSHIHEYDDLLIFFRKVKTD